MISIHEDTLEKLKGFYENRSIPNIIFHGPSGSGKRTLLGKFMDIVYQNDQHVIKDYVLYVNCAQGKGIKFIREDLKHFAKTHINTQNGNRFKSIILTNADKLTIDAQSALRRCIEVFSHTTRFFIVVEDKYKLLRPIMSRFCEVYVQSPLIDGEHVNLYKYKIQNSDMYNERVKSKSSAVKRIINKLKDNIDVKTLGECSETLYDRGFTCLDVIEYFKGKTPFNISTYYHNHVLFYFGQARKEYRNEKLAMFFLLDMFLLCSNDDLENMIVM
jgi:DNA polymerase III delta prime subunit